ncbi:response regulator [Celerinatantimonas diazotrophica]|uniref:Transcriptional regulatory protein n=1 Tax=Celerinatantimonas diazotrophica TaxID=412034 RepID=A0A4R1J9Y0_9GAMM|nr:response regulator [Celerinatantimonas diazotrophica]TCK47422.1 two-component system response regulator CitB [Celerinatantimonas diazotrophica]CAG9294960.1 Transcriptional regulatory protein DpiA [Celerinatantimonas diazotrophica]
MKVFNVLIVEDQSNIAEFHADFLNKTQKFVAVGIAKNIREAKSMIAIIKPDLVILDNYLPDGKGIELMKDINAKENPSDIIFVTAASDMDTVSKAIRAGAFDYLLKPISYDRLEDSLNRYLSYKSTLESTDSVNQKYVDLMLNYQSKAGETGENLPKGIDQLTLDKIKAIFSDDEVIHTTDSLLLEVGISKTTARRYLEYCILSGFLQAEICHGKIGRPERRFRKKTVAK